MKKLNALISGEKLTENDAQKGAARFWEVVDRKEYVAQRKRLMADGLTAADWAVASKVLEKMFVVLALSEREENALGYLRSALTQANMTPEQFNNFVGKAADLLGV